MPLIIRANTLLPQVENDPWLLIRDITETAAMADAHCILPLALWQAQRALGVLHANSHTGVWIGASDEYEARIDELLTLPLIAIDFPSFRDGRAYTVAFLLRTRYGYRGELRAIGDVLRDQLFYMHRCGFDTFVVREDKDIQDALKGLTEYTIRYQGAVDDPVPLFRKRAMEMADLNDEHWEP